MKKLIFILIALMLLPNALAVTLTVSIGTYDTSVAKNEQFSVPATVTLSGSAGSTTVDVTIDPVTGLSCTTCTKQLSFTGDGSQQSTFTLTADTAGTYSSPFTVTAEAAGVTPGSDTADNPITVSESALWSVDLTSNTSSVAANGSVTLQLTVTVTAGTLEGVTADLTLASGWSITSGTDPYSMGTISSVGTASWTVYSGTSPGETNIINVSVASTTPADSKSDSVSITGPEEEEEEEAAAGGGGGGGGAAAPAVNQSTKVWQIMTPGAASIMKITNKDLGIKQISITVSNPANNVEITVKKLSKQPATITKTITGKVYKFLEVTKKNLQDANLAKVEMEFMVEKTWLNSNNIDEGTVRLYRYSGTDWAALSTAKTGGDTNYMYYTAASPGLSVFAIAGEQKVVAEQPKEEKKEEEEAPEEEKPAVTPPEEKPQAQAAQPFRKKILIGVALVILVIAIAALVFMYNQNPEFRASIDDLKENLIGKFKK